MHITLKAARVNMGMPQKKAAELIGISVDTLKNYERGKTFPDVLTLKKIEKAYGVRYENIIFLPRNNT